MIILAVIASILVSSGLSIFSKKILDRSVSPLLLLTASSIIGALLLAPVFVYHHPSVTNAIFFALLVVAVLRFMAAWPINASIKLSEVSFITQFSSAETIFGVLFGILFLSEFPTVYGLLGMGLIILGSIWLTKFGPPASWKKAVGLRLLGSAFIAASSVLLRGSLKNANQLLTGAIVWMVFALISIPLTIYALKKNPEQKQALKNNLNLLLIISVLAVINYLLQIYIFSKIQVGYAFALLQLGLLVNIILAGKFLNEKKYLSRLLPASVIIAGVVIIYYLK